MAGKKHWQKITFAKHNMDFAQATLSGRQCDCIDWYMTLHPVINETESAVIRYDIRVIIFDGLMVIFTARRASIARTMPWQDVCPSHAGIVSKRLNVSSNFLPQDSHTILVFLYQTVHNTPTGTSQMGASHALCPWKNRDFRPVSRFYIESDTT